MHFSSHTLRAYQKQRLPRAMGKLCHAPDTSMYFGHGGRVTACCYNRDNVLGYYPQQSVGEIWSGVAANLMRREMSSSSFATGCQLCDGPMKAENFKGLLASNYDTYAPPLDKQLGAWFKQLFSSSKPQAPLYPRLFEFELSNTCNLECIMCSGEFSSSIRQNREQQAPIPDTYDAAFVQQLIPFLPHLQGAKFYGGEPFLINTYYAIWEALIEHNPNALINITTNGTIFNNKVKRVLEKLNCDLVISLDSIVKTTYEQIRLNANYDRVMANIEEFQRYRGKNISIAICPMTINAYEMPGLIAWANEQGFNVGFNIVNYPDHLSLQNQSKDELSRLLDFYTQQKLPTDNVIHRYNQDKFRGLINQVAYWLEKVHQGKSISSVASLQYDSHTDQFKIILVNAILQFEKRNTHPNLQALFDYAAQYHPQEDFFSHYLLELNVLFADFEGLTPEELSINTTKIHDFISGVKQIIPDTQIFQDFTRTILEANPLEAIKFITSNDTDTSLQQAIAFYQSKISA